jgi:hypothetical protein
MNSLIINDISLEEEKKITPFRKVNIDDCQFIHDITK